MFDIRHYIIGIRHLSVIVLGPSSALGLQYKGAVLLVGRLLVFVYHVCICIGSDEIRDKITVWLELSGKEVCNWNYSIIVCIEAALTLLWMVAMMVYQL